MKEVFCAWKERLKNPGKAIADVTSGTTGGSGRELKKQIQIQIKKKKEEKIRRKS